jgi:hypothetical protein
MEAKPQPFRKPNGSEGAQAKPNKYDQLLQDTCKLIVSTVAEAIDAEPATLVTRLGLESGLEYGRQIVISVPQEDGLLNVCRLTVLNSSLNPEAEVARIEYEHDKQTKFGLERSYSLQSVRKRGAELVLMENFLADAPEHVREADFRPILSDSYAQETVLKNLREWTGYRAYQIQHS